MFIIKGVTSKGSVVFYEAVAGKEKGFVNVHRRNAFKFDSLEGARMILDRLNSAKSKHGIFFIIFRVEPPKARGVRLPPEKIKPSPFEFKKVNIHFSDEDIESAYLSSGWWRMASRIRDQVNKMNSEVRP